MKFTPHDCQVPTVGTDVQAMYKFRENVSGNDQNPNLQSCSNYTSKIESLILFINPSSKL
jgi:hypothetical protein